MERVERVENPDLRAFCTQGIVGVGAIIRTCTVSFRRAASRPTARVGSARAMTSSSFR